MKRLSIALAAIVLSLAATAEVRADELPPPIRVTASVLNLSDDQVRVLVETIRARDAALGPVAEQLEQKRQALARLIEQGTADPAAVGTLVLEIAAGEKAFIAAARQAAEAFEQQLSTEQQERLNAIRGAAPVCDVMPALRAVGLL